MNPPFKLHEVLASNSCRFITVQISNILANQVHKLTPRQQQEMRKESVSRKAFPPAQRIHHKLEDVMCEIQCIERGFDEASLVKRVLHSDLKA